MKHFFLLNLLRIPQALFALDFPSTPPLEPKNAAKTFHVLDGFEMQLIAAEPLVTDPVAITYDADGRAYVCEMNDYPYTDKAAHKPAQENPTDQSIGRVRLLTDTDGDGVFDKATVFADGLSWPTGTACWKGGIFVTATPDVWYLKDTNDDGVADVRQKVFTGFKKLNVQAVMNNPIWGLDHRIYIAGGSNGGEIQRVPGSESVMPIPKDFKPLSIKRNDFSFDPSTGDVRLESGGARFGQTFDDWGNRFLCNIRNPCQHVVLPYRYLARNPYLVVPSALNDCAEAGDQLPVYRTSPAEPWREFRAKRWSAEGSTLPKSELVGAGVVTSSAGITVYRGDAYPKEYRDFAFVADVAGNLFYRMKLVPDGVTFEAVQVDGKANFCTSDDLWFRPVNFVNAPDGCLHVCDMYREVIEHPWSIPDDIHTAVDLLRGRDRGRIWRLAPKSGPLSPLSGASQTKQPPKTAPHAQSPNNPLNQQGKNNPARTAQRTVRTTLLSHASTTDLVALLDHPNAWHRETAQRLLFERQDKTAVEPLRKLVKSGKTAQGRIAALWTLSKQFQTVETTNLPHEAEKLIAVNIAESDDLLQALVEALSDQNPNLRRSAIYCGSNTIDRLRGKMKALGALHMPFQLSPEEDQLRRLLQSTLHQDAAATVRFARILEAHDWSEEVAEADVKDPWTQHAILLTNDRTCNYALSWVCWANSIPDSPGMTKFVENAAKSCGRANQSDEVYELLAKFKDLLSSKPLIASAGLIGLHSGAVQAGRSLDGDLDELSRVFKKSLTVPRLTEFKAWFARLFDKSDEVPRIAELKQWLLQAPVEASDRALEKKAPLAHRVMAIRLMTIARWEDARMALSSLLAPSQPQELQLAALEALGSYHEPAVADMLIDAWPKMTPALRDKATTILLSRTDRIAKLLDAIEAKKITPAQLSVAAKATLGRQKTPALAERIAKLIGDGSSSNRKEVIEKYLVAMGIKERGTPSPSSGGQRPPLLGDAARGAKIYETACMVCHKFADKGNDVGPHLGTIKAWTAEQLVTNILDPNREVSPNFALYIVETNDGRTLSGLIASETAGNLTLKRADGDTDTVLRSEIKSLTSPGISLMPEGLEAAITPQQMADLIAYLKAP